MNLRRTLAVKLMLILVVTFESATSYSDYKPSEDTVIWDRAYSSIVGDSLYVTPLLEAGQADSARRKAKVEHQEMQDIESFAGYFTVNKQFDSNLFFWYFPAKENSTTAPVVLHLEGGPSLTMLFSIASQNGPFSVKKDRVLETRKESWINKQNVIYIDSPVGTGYSFTEYRHGYAKTFTQVADHLFIAVQQFFQLFPSLRKNDFFVAGWGHASKTILPLSYSIHLHNEDADRGEKINLKGIAISTPQVTPFTTRLFDEIEYLYDFGLVDANGRDQLQNELMAAKNDHSVLDSLNTHLKTLTAYDSVVTILKTTHSIPIGYACAWGTSVDVRRFLHVGNKTFLTVSNEAKDHLKSDDTHFKSNLVATLLEHYQVLIYTGQLSLNCPYYSVRKYLENLSWSGAYEFKIAERQQWRVASGELAGYITKAGNLYEVLVRNAGYWTIYDQPQWILELVEKFTHGSL